VSSEGESIVFPFNERKAAQAAALLVKRHGGACDYLTLIKLLYLADRAAFVETGLPITGDRWVSMRYGPVVSRVKDCLNAHQGIGAVFREYVSLRDDNNRVRLASEDVSFDLDELSDYEIRILETVDDEHGTKTFDEWMDFLHRDLPEWHDPGATSVTIPPAEVLAGAGLPRESIEKMLAETAAWLRTLKAGGGRGL
jgi:hypothetical protein